MSPPYMVQTAISVSARQYIKTPFSFRTNVWIQRFALELVVVQTEPHLLHIDSVLCHAWLRFPKLSRASSEDTETIDALLGISMNPYSIEFPAGFGLQILHDSISTFEVQIQNYVYPEPAVRIQFKAIIEYTELPQQELFYDTLYIQSDMQAHHTKPLGKDKNWVYSALPGVDHRCSPVPPTARRGITIHTLNIHAHPYADYVELRRISDKTTFWRGNITQLFGDGTGAPNIVRADSIFNTEGIVLSFEDLEICAQYTNPTKYSLQVMAGVKFWYARSE